MIRFIPVLAVAALLLPAGVSQAQNFQSDVAKAQKTLDDINKAIDGMGGGGATRAAAAPAAGTPAPARRGGGQGGGQNAGPRVYTVLLKGSMCGACAGELNKALGGVANCKVVTACKKGDGAEGLTLAVIEMTGNTRGLAAAVQGAKTPHASQCAPGASAIIAGRLKADASAAAVAECLKKAASSGELAANANPNQRRQALQKAGLVQ